MPRLAWRRAFGPSENLLTPRARAKGPLLYQTGATPRDRTTTLPKGLKARPIPPFRITLTQSGEILSRFTDDLARIEHQQSVRLQKKGVLFGRLFHWCLTCYPWVATSALVDQRNREDIPATGGVDLQEENITLILFHDLVGCARRSDISLIDLGDDHAGAES